MQERSGLDIDSDGTRPTYKYIVENLLPYIICLKRPANLNKGFDDFIVNVENKNVSKDKTFHSCQIPLKLVEMLIKSCTNEGDSVFILFGGSGSELVLCEKLKRKWLSCELHKPYYEMFR